MEFGAPYRARLESSYADPNAFLTNSPDIRASVDLGTSALSRALSVNGNPAGSGRALTEIQDYATKGLYAGLGNERQRLANFGGLSALTGAAPGTASAAISAQGTPYAALGYSIQQVTNPQPSPADLYKALGIKGFA